MSPYAESAFFKSVWLLIYTHTHTTPTLTHTQTHTLKKRENLWKGTDVISAPRFLFFSVCLLDLDFSFVIFSGGSILLLFFLVKKKNYKFLGMFKLKSKGGRILLCNRLHIYWRKQTSAISKSSMGAFFSDIPPSFFSPSVVVVAPTYINQTNLFRIFLDSIVGSPICNHIPFLSLSLFLCVYPAIIIQTIFFFFHLLTKEGWVGKFTKNIRSCDIFPAPLF